MFEDTPKQKYDFKTIESKWQSKWNDDKLYEAVSIPDPINKFYMLVMFAYPSGDIHMGHFRNYIIGDAAARYQMMLGKDVLHPFGWDAFGLPAERAAISRNIHPEDWTLDNVGISRETLQKVGISYDWSREVTTCLPDYYKWTQWMFAQLFKKGLAYRKRGFVNWCPEDKTVLANEQVKDGCCERCGTEIEKRDQMQWYFKITDYADRLIDDLDKLPNWPDNVKAMQKEWIGRSYGLEVNFTIEETGQPLPVFTTRPDTIYGVTFMAISPEAELLDQLDMDDEHKAKVKEYKKEAAKRTDIERAAITDDKDGVFTGKYAINPFNGEKIQLWVADYVLAGYGTGAVMAVPAHDTRDFAFANKYDIPIKVVIKNENAESQDAKSLQEAFTEYGAMINSDQFDGKIGKDAIEAVSKYAEEKKIGHSRVNFKLKDWSLSRQRYWGCPIPIVHCPKCGEVLIDDADLPLVLPKVKDFVPKGRSPLADVPEFMNTTCPKCGGEAERDPDTMDTFVCSSWYHMRYVDAHNDLEPFSKEALNAWLPVDLYVGGITHATGHLLYFRFFTKFMHDIGWLDCDEPATRLFNHGMVTDGDGVVMSKSLGNVVSPIAVMEERGVDVSRLAMFFTAPSEKGVLWSDDGITGVAKFAANKVYPLPDHYRKTDSDLKYHFKPDSLSGYERDIYVKLNQTIKKVSDSYGRLHFNTGISALMELLRDYKPSEVKNDLLNDQIVLKSIQMIAPLTPHLAEELWLMCEMSGSVFKSNWPEYDPEAIISDLITIAVQINGKVRDTVEVSVDDGQEVVEKAAFASEKVQQHLDGKDIKRKIFVKGRLLNIVAK